MKLRFGEWKANQLFFLQRADAKNYPNLFWIRQDRDSNKHLMVTESGVACKETNHPNENCLWELMLARGNEVINRSCYIEYAFSNMVLDVPRASEKPGVAICQYPCNNRFNQRWNLYKHGDFYQIQNLKTKMFLDVKGESKKPGAAIIQWSSTGAVNQLWKIEYQGKNIFLIRSAMD